MNNKKILKIILAGTAFSGGMALADKSVAATELTYDEIEDLKESTKSYESYEGKVINVKTNLRVRNGATFENNVIGYLINDEVVNIKGETDEWYRIDFKGNDAYVKKEYIEINSIYKESKSIGKGRVYNTGGAGLNIRQSASTNSSIIGGLKDGEIVKVMFKSGSWYNISYGNKTGFVHSSYINMIETSVPDINSNITKGKVINISSNLRVRELPNKNSATIGYLLNGQEVEIISEDREWYKINFNKKVGYAHKDYITKIPNNSSDDGLISYEKYGVVKAKNGLRVRSGTGTYSSILGVLNNGTTIKIVGESGDWYRIKYRLGYGYVHKDYIKVNASENNNKVTSIGTVTASSLNIRSLPNIRADIKNILSVNDIVEIFGEENGWYKIKYKDGSAYVSSDYVRISTGLSNYGLTVDKFADLQLPSLNLVKKNGKWVHADIEDIKYYMNPSNFINNNSKYMFMKLNYVDGIPMSVINEVIQGRGILSGKGVAFLKGAKKYNVNVMYLLSHARLETGNGTSQLANGVLVTEVDGVPVEPKVVYNMYGIGAIDSDPIKGGAEYAYKQGWFTPELAITHGASWISRNYINSSKYNQNTLYKMKWNMSSKSIGWHQYASDIGWAEKQAKIIAPYLEKCGVAFEFDIPTFKK